MLFLLATLVFIFITIYGFLENHLFSLGLLFNPCPAEIDKTKSFTLEKILVLVSLDPPLQTLNLLLKLHKFVKVSQVREGGFNRRHFYFPSSN